MRLIKAYRCRGKNPYFCARGKAIDMSFLLDFLAISAYRWRIDRGVAQLVEQRPPKPWAEGSSPSTPVQALCHVHEAFFCLFLGDLGRISSCIRIANTHSVRAFWRVGSSHLPLARLRMPPLGNPNYRRRRHTSLRGFRIDSRFLASICPERVAAMHLP